MIGITPSVDERRYERINGQLVERPVANTAHTLVQSQALVLLWQALQTLGFAGAEWSITRPGHANKDDPDYMTADVMVVYPPVIRTKNNHLTAAFLAIEVVSPGQGEDLIEKAIRYAALGVPHVWIINPDTRVCLEFHGGDTLTIEREQLHAGDLTVNVGDVFAALNRLENLRPPIRCSALNLSQERFAQKLGVSYPSVNRWEHGHSKPQFRTLQGKIKVLEDRYLLNEPADVRAELYGEEYR